MVFLRFESDTKKDTDISKVLPGGAGYVNCSLHGTFWSFWDFAVAHPATCNLETGVEWTEWRSLVKSSTTLERVPQMTCLLDSVFTKKK